MPGLQSRAKRRAGCMSDFCSLCAMVSGVQIRLNRRKSARHFKAIFCADISVVRVLSAQPASPVSVRDVRFGEIRATFERVSERSRGLRGMFFWIFARNQPISRASLWSPIYNFRVLTPETRLECAETGCSCPIAFTRRSRRNPENRHGYPCNNCGCSVRLKWHIRFEPMQHPAWKQVHWVLAHQ